MIKVVLKGIAVDNITGMPIVLLADEENENDIYPIWIGVVEAEGIVLSQSGFKPPRPLTYDLFKNVIESMGGKVVAAEIVDKVDNAYIANLVIEKDGIEIKVDARPSDAINLAIRFGAPIYINEEVVQKVHVEMAPKPSEEIQKEQSIPADTESKPAGSETEKTITDDDLETFRKMLENLKPDDFLLNKGETV